jgi:hypothetical protein
LLASVYAVLGEIALRQGADDCLPVRPTKIAKYFIWSDVLTFLVQAGGGGMEVKEDLSNIGSKVRRTCLAFLLIGLTGYRFSLLV